VVIDRRIEGWDCVKLAPGGGYVLGSSAGIIMEGISPHNFVTMTQAVRSYGRYGSLGNG
jgi:hypothetical protein